MCTREISINYQIINPVGELDKSKPRDVTPRVDTVYSVAVVYLSVCHKLLFDQNS